MPRLSKAGKEITCPADLIGREERIQAFIRHYEAQGVNIGRRKPVLPIKLRSAIQAPDGRIWASAVAAAKDLGVPAYTIQRRARAGKPINGVVYRMVKAFAGPHVIGLTPYTIRLMERRLDKERKRG